MKKNYIKVTGDLIEIKFTYKIILYKLTFFII